MSVIHSPEYARYLLADYNGKKAISDALVAAISWKEGGVYLIGDCLEGYEGPQDYPMYLCALDEEGSPWIGVICSVVSPDPENWGRPYLHPLSEVILQN
jgi:hypothetical protein